MKCSLPRGFILFFLSLRRFSLAGDGERHDDENSSFKNKMQTFSRVHRNSNVLSWNINTDVLNHLLIHLLRHLAVSVDLLCVFVHLLASRGNVCVCVFPLRHPADKLQTSRDTQISDYTFQSFWDVHRISWGILPEELQFNSASLASEWLCRFYFTVYSFIHECLITWFSIWKIYGDSRNKV